MRDPWTAELVDLLQRLWASGATAGAIAAQLGVSRSGVPGKIHRLRRGRGALPGIVLKPRRARPRRRSKQKEPPLAPPRSTPKRLVDLTNHCCRWPITARGLPGISFCAAPEADLAGGMPYCAYHARRAYVIPPERNGAVTPPAAPAGEQSEAVRAPRRRNVWRAAVRHPAPRPR